MKTPVYYETVTEAIDQLAKRGYTFDFEINSIDDCLYCHNNAVSLAPEDFEIDETHRFEGNTDPGDEMIVYAISSVKHQLKGVVVNAFGIYADDKSSKIVARLKTHEG